MILNLNQTVAGSRWPLIFLFVKLHEQLFWRVLFLRILLAVAAVALLLIFLFSVKFGTLCHGRNDTILFLDSHQFLSKVVYLGFCILQLLI